jgi:hypothetical protein
MAELQLNQGRVVVVDDADLPKLTRFKWFYHNEGYAFRHVLVDGRLKTVYLHQHLLQPPDGHQVLFKDRDGLNCRRSNLLLVTIQESRRAARPRKNASSQYKGVRFHKKLGKFTAYIKLDGRDRYLGSFADEKQAALAYDRAAHEHFGECAYLNFPDEVLRSNEPSEDQAADRSVSPPPKVARCTSRREKATKVKGGKEAAQRNRQAPSRRGSTRRGRDRFAP